MSERCNRSVSIHARNPRERRGLVLIIVLVVIVLLALSAYTYTALMLTEHEAAELSGRQIQARELVASGVETVRLFLLQDELTQIDAGGTYDNPLVFQGRLVADDADPLFRGRFTVIAPALDGEGNPAGVRFGLEDESTRINLNALLLADQTAENGGRQLLMSLPGMDEYTADAIMDWIDPDDDPREYGAEVEYYSTLDLPYAPKNGPLDTVEELLLVKGMQPELLFGLDINRNGMIDSHEAGRSSTLQVQGMGASTSSVASEELAARGWSSFLTLFSQEKNVNAAGAPRVYINGENMEELFNQVQEILDDKWATFIVAYRQNGPFTGEDEATEARSGQLDLTLPAQATFVTVLDLVDATVRVTFDGEDEPTIMRSLITTENMAFVMPLLMDNLSTNPTPTIPGRININQAPRFMLLGIPGMEESIVDEIISRRDIVSDDDDPNRKHETWLLVEGIVPDLDTMKALLPYVCIGGDVHRAQVVGYFEGGEVSSRAEVIFDATGQDIRILLWRDISHLGRGFALETLGTELLPDL